MTSENYLLLAIGIVALIMIFIEDIDDWFRSVLSSFGVSFSRPGDNHHTPSVSNLPPPTHVLHSERADDSDEDFPDEEYPDEPDEDDLRIARNERMAAILKPFDRVLVRDDDTDNWIPRFFAYYDDDDEDYPFYCTAADDHFAECIPYEGNENLYLQNDDFDYSRLFSDEGNK